MDAIRKEHWDLLSTLLDFIGDGPVLQRWKIYIGNITNRPYPSNRTVVDDFDILEKTGKMAPGNYDVLLEFFRKSDNRAIEFITNTKSKLEEIRRHDGSFYVERDQGNGDGAKHRSMEKYSIVTSSSKKINNQSASSQTRNDKEIRGERDAPKRKRRETDENQDEEQNASSAKLRKEHDDTVEGHLREIFYTNVWQQSVGYLMCGDGTGTGFRVGTRYLMTAYHVIEEHMGNYKEKVIEEAQRDPNRQLNYRKLLQKLAVDDLPEADVEKNIENVINEWMMRSSDNLKFSNLLQTMEDTGFLKAKEELSTFFKKNLMCVFLGRMREEEGFKYFLKTDVPFYSKEDDIAILEFEDSHTNLQKPFVLNKTDSVYPKYVHIVGYPDSHAVRQTDDFNCPLISHDEAISAHEKAFQWWRETFPENQADLYFRSYDEMFSGIKALFHCSKSTTHGASGSPGWFEHLDKDKPKVYLMLQGAYPGFLNDFAEQFKDKNIPHYCFIEYGIEMSTVYDLLSVMPHLKELRDDIFHT